MNDNGRLAKRLGLALGIVAAIIWLQGALAATIIILLAAILYRLAQPAPSRSAASLSPPSSAPSVELGSASAPPGTSAETPRPSP